MVWEIHIKSENSQDYAKKPQRNCAFMNSAFMHVNCLYCTYKDEQIKNANSVKNLMWQLPNEGDSNCLATELARAIEAALQGSINIQIFTIYQRQVLIYMQLPYSGCIYQVKIDEHMFMTPLNPPWWGLISTLCKEVLKSNLRPKKEEK